MLLLEGLHLALWGVIELQRRVASVEMLLLLLLLLLLLCLKRRRGLGEYIGNLRLEDRVLMNRRRVEALLMLDQEGLR
jgi:hypothetical protein